MLYNVQECFKIKNFICLFHASRESGYVFPGESHNFWECVYVKKGQVVTSTDENVYTLKKGDIIFHEPLAFHKYHIENKKGAELFIFSFNMDGIKADYFKQKVFALNPKQIKMVQNLLDYVAEKVPDFYEKTSGDYSLKVLKKNEVYLSTVTNYVYTLFLSLLDTSDVVFETATESTDIFKQAIKYMHENVSEKLTINNIAEKCCTNTTSLKKIFLELSGYGVHKYFLIIKLRHAMHLLNKHTVSETAEILGFSSQAYFSAAFKRETGFSPTEYRDLFRNKA